MVPKIVSSASSSVVKQNKKISSLKQMGLVKKVGDFLHQPAFQAAPPACLVHVWRGDRRQRKLIVRKIVPHTFGKLSQITAWQLECFHPHRKRVRVHGRGKKYCWSFFSILLEFLLPRDVALES